MSDRLTEIERRLSVIENHLGLNAVVPYGIRATPLTVTTSCGKCGYSLAGVSGYACPASDCPMQSRAP